MKIICICCVHLSLYYVCIFLWFLLPIRFANKQSLVALAYINGLFYAFFVQVECTIERTAIYFCRCHAISCDCFLTKSIHSANTHSPFLLPYPIVIFSLLQTNSCKQHTLYLQLFTSHFVDILLPASYIGFMSI